MSNRSANVLLYIGYWRGLNCYDIMDKEIPKVAKDFNGNMEYIAQFFVLKEK